MRNLESDSVADENGVATVSVQAKKGQLIQLCFSTLPDENGSYPAANLRFNAAFTAGEVTDTEAEKKLLWELLEECSQQKHGCKLAELPDVVHAMRRGGYEVMMQ